MSILYFLCLLALIMNELGLGDKDKVDLLWTYILVSTCIPVSKQRK